MITVTWVSLLWSETVSLSHLGREDVEHYALANRTFWNITTMPSQILSCVLSLHQGQTPFDVADEGLVEHLEMLQKKQTVVSFWRSFSASPITFSHTGVLQDMWWQQMQEAEAQLFSLVTHLQS